MPILHENSTILLDYIECVIGIKQRGISKYFENYKKYFLVRSLFIRKDNLQHYKLLLQ